MQTSAMETGFQIAECSLSYAKLATFSQNNSLSTQNLSKNACFYSFSVPPVPAARRLPAPGVFGISISHII